jgi:myo-inositol 2-dehydrogenase/D-chiro-inositol 1-dehydrogenase
MHAVLVADAHGVRTRTTPTFYERFADAFLREAVHFTECIAHDRAPALTLHDATEATRLAVALRTSLTERRVVEP